jgi:hypothetical protein
MQKIDLLYKQNVHVLPVKDTGKKRGGKLNKVAHDCLNSHNTPACLDWAIQTRKPLSNCFIK